ncbi:FecR domain-containing protein [Kangiella sp. TOML190]|uniref:FecR domain-containing protein n=1 Tax=Kangiella sp. TOML190 TaxID=2931351 RepID=UPI00203F6553|nr:FecR domain-containing protein [Kangiella sp. TOML190]
MKKHWLIRLLIAGLIVTAALPIFAKDWLYTVRKGDSASAIANKYLTNPYRIDDILRYNQLVPGEDLTAGSVIKFPLNSLKFGPARVSVLSVQGEVNLVRGDLSQALETSSSIKLGDKVITGEDASTTLRFADKSELLLGSSSELIFDVLTRWGRTGMVDSRMRLMKGSVEGRVETLQGPGAHFEVHTPSAVATVRGTEFRVRVDGNNTKVSYNEVSEGKVKVENKVSEELIPQGFGLVSEQGKQADKPIELLSAPTLNDPQANFPSLPVRISWQADSAAVGYRYELFKGSDINQQIATDKVTDTAINMNQLAAGDYTVRLRKIDSNGLEGLNRVHRFTLNGAPLAPTNLLAKSELLFGEPIELSWQPSEKAEFYNLEIASDSEFSSIVQQQQVESNQLTLTQPMETRDYFWRVNAQNEEGIGYYSQSSSFSVVLADTPMVASAADVELGQGAALSWQPVPYAKDYHWQLARDADFTNLVEQGRSNQTSISFDDLPAGDYYFRVATDAPNDTQRFSETQSFEVFEPGNGKNPFMLSSLLLLLLAL